MIHEFEGSEVEMSGFMVQVLELLQKLNEKADNAATRLLLLEKKKIEERNATVENGKRNNGRGRRR